MFSWTATAIRLDRDTECVVKGDARSLSIAAASIVAKVARDRIMDKLDKEIFRLRLVGPTPVMARPSIARRSDAWALPRTPTLLRAYSQDF